jgi:putative hydrolase of the HAD superfamily
VNQGSTFNYAMAVHPPNQSLTFTLEDGPPGGDEGPTLERVQANTPLLSRLHRRYRLGIVSNFYGNLGTVCHNAGIHPFFSVIVDSTRVGCSKPDPRIFQSALDELALAPADVVFVGDSLPRDMAGARAIGMPHIWLVGDGAPPSAPCCPGDRLLRSLEELEELLP